MSLTQEYRENPEGVEPKFRVYIPLTWAFVWAWNRLKPLLRNAGLYGFILITWRPADDRAEGFRIYFGTESGKYTHYAVVLGGKASGKTLELDTTKRWFFAMSAFNSVGESPLTNEISVGAAPGKPKSVKGQKAEPTEIETVSFENPL